MKLFKRKSLKGSIKKAFDHLPSGLCFFTEKDILVLCNYQMHRLVFALTGRDLQSMSDLREALKDLPKSGGAKRDGDFILLPGEGAWHFTEKLVKDDEGRSYIQFLAVNGTALYEKTKELKEKNTKLAEMSARMETINKNIAAIMKEEEFLSMKMRVHNEVGSCVLSTRKYYLEGCREKQKEELLPLWQKTLALLKNGICREGKTDPYQELLEAAAIVGAKIILTGHLPGSPLASYLIICAIREALTNAIRHGRGDQLFVKIEEDDTRAIATITNNGDLPKGEFTEGGGLSSLRTRIERAGGTMTIACLPEFTLIVNVLKEGGQVL